MADLELVGGPACGLSAPAGGRWTLVAVASLGRPIRHAVYEPRHPDYSKADFVCWDDEPNTRYARWREARRG